MVQIPGIPLAVPGQQTIAQSPNLQGRLQQPTIDHKKEQFKTFKETLDGFIMDVNKLQHEAGRSVEKLLTGEIKDVHDVMIAVEKAGTSFELMMEIRNKMIEAYHEVLRMQV